MEPQTIKVTIDAKGNATIHVLGVKGSECLTLTQGLELALGGQVADRQYTDEYFEQTSEQETGYAD